MQFFLNFVSKKLAVRTFWLIALQGKKMKNVEKSKAVKSFKEFENEDEKNEDFFYLAKIFQIIFFSNFELR